MFEQQLEDDWIIHRVEIPLIQRDYAQGRKNAAVSDIRESFLAALLAAVVGGEPLGLDFVYGHVEDGTLQPLDGQQRLTTLFLLHWYLAFRAGVDVIGAAWTNFTYATRPSARLFCERIIANPPPGDEGQPSEWVQDQGWYLHVWRHDPTIQSMLVMIDAIHTCFADVEPADAWGLLVDSAKPAVVFNLLPIEDMGSAADLYIKMNSRGKPLTPFENFKARFEQAISKSDRVAEFARKVDGDWSDLLWPIHGGDNIVDDEFMHYFEFVIEICEWRQRRQDNGRLVNRAELVFGDGQPDSVENLTFLFDTFDTWVGADTGKVFEACFTAAETVDTSRVRLYGPNLKLNMFEDCSHSYGDLQGNSRSFSLSQTLLFYAVLLHRIHDTYDFPRRLRILRNLNEASVANELRLDRMPDLVATVRRLVIDGTLDGTTGFNQNQVGDERRKAQFIDDHPDLHSAVCRLEDDPLLRGSLTAFELNSATFELRADAFRQVMTTDRRVLTGALLSVGDYSRRRYPGHWLGAPTQSSWWRDFLTTGTYAELAKVRITLATLLDRVAQSELNVDDALKHIRRQWLAETAISKVFDWRYYLVRYDVMRSGTSGVYATPNSVSMGYLLGMLDGKALNGYYHDPYLSAIVEESATTAAVETPLPDLKFTGYADTPRWLRLSRSGVRLRCIDIGFQLDTPADDSHERGFGDVLQRHSIGDDLLLLIPQQDRDGVRIDTEDRIQIGAALLRDLISAGL